MSGSERVNCYAAGQRSTESGPRGNIAFGYNSRSELTTASGHTAGAFAYAYDPIGTTGGWGASGEIPLQRNPEGEMSGSERVNCSRLNTTQSGNAITYSSNALNQYTTIHRNGSAFAAYDPNGNQTRLRTAHKAFDAAYDDENRLVALTTATGADQSSTFRYDALSRRVETIERSNGVATKSIRYVYDGFLPVEEHEWNGLPNGPPSSIRYLTRGTDLSGSLSRAGGIGGLLVFTENAATSYYFADANGNITALYNASDSPTATYTYDPFGRLVASAGSLATRNTYQWSSKEHHAPTGLVYYLYRFYNPEDGRWLNRDPIREAGGVNLYASVFNDPINLADPDGEAIFIPILLAAWAVAEVGLSIWDLYDTIATLSDPCATEQEKLVAGGLFLAGIFLPGGGYSQIDDLAKFSVKKVTKAENELLLATKALPSAKPPGLPDPVPPRIPPGTPALFPPPPAAKGTPAVRFHSTSPQAVNPIFEGGFRIDLPNPVAAGRNSRFGQGVYLSDSPAAALAERPGGVVLSVDVNLGRNLNILNRGPITDPAMAKAIARGARKHGYDSITTQSVRPGGGVNNVIFDPANAQPRAILLE